jgi:hypothetical protein
MAAVAPPESSDLGPERYAPQQDRHPGLDRRLSPSNKYLSFVIPAKAGIQFQRRRWIPAFAGMTSLLVSVE